MKDNVCACAYLTLFIILLQIIVSVANILAMGRACVEGNVRSDIFPVPF